MTDTMRIPKQAKRVFKGVIFDIYHWPQKMYDGSTATFEMIKRPGAVRIIATQNNEIILNHEKQPGIKRSLGTFGGRINKNENPLACAKRELLEEAGLKSNDWELLNSYEPYYEKMDFTVYVYVARNCKKVQEPNLDPGEKIKTSKVKFEEFLKIILDKNSFMTKEFVLDILRLKFDGKINTFKKKLFKK